MDEVHKIDSPMWDFVTKEREGKKHRMEQYVQGNK